jgi:transcriptional regulator GlxA family with amidase domain
MASTPASPSPAAPGRQRTIGVVLFPKFELLDVFGPLEMFGLAPEEFRIVMLGPSMEPVESTPGPRIDVDATYEDAPPLDILFVPGGLGTRVHPEDARLRDWLAARGATAEYVTSVCTGAASLALAGLLDGYRATSNKRSFGWVREQGPQTEWVPQARWVEDRNRWTSSGIAAGTDMALALIAHLHGDAFAEAIALRAEYEWHRDAGWDPFAAHYGLAEGTTRA